MFKTPRDLYHSKEWQQLRDQLMIERVNEDGQLICCRCGKPILKRYDCIGHHKIELTEENVNDFEISLNPEHIELICFRCHNMEHERFGGFRQKVYLVHGAPCAGKTTFVKEHAHSDDLILDIDAIWEAVCLSDRDHKPNRLKPNVFGIRDTIIDQIRTRTGTWRNAWVIGTYPLVTERQRVCDLLGAEPLHIDTDEATCLERAKDNEAWQEYIHTYFDGFSCLP